MTTAAKGKVDPGLIAEYRREGWIKSPYTLSAQQIETVRAAVDEAERREDMGLSGQSAAAGTGTAETFSYQNDERFTKMWTNAVDLRHQYEGLHEIVADLSEVAAELVGEDVVVFWDKTFNKPPASAGTRQTVWHQDWPYNPIDRRGMMTFWIAVEDVSVEAGALRFLPRSHKLGPLGRVDLVGADHAVEDLLREDDLEQVGEIVSIPLAAGESTVHDALLFHGAGENLSDQPRRGWTVVFVPAETRWNGAPHPHASINELGVELFGRFDHPHFQVVR